MMFSTRVFKFTLAAFLAAIALNLPATALAQTTCPNTSGVYLSGDCVNSDVQDYTETSSATVTGIYTNEPSGQVTATGDNGFTALIVDGFVNSGMITASGQNSGSGVYVNNGGFTNNGAVIASGESSGRGIYVDGGFTNNGTVSAEGIDGSTGIMVVSGGFINSGTVDASVSGSKSVYGYGLYVGNGGFANNGGTVTATNSGSGDSTGLYVSNGGFTNNSGTVYATAIGTNTSTNIGLYVGGIGFTNSDTVYATGSNSGYGLWVNNGGFTNSGTVTASGYSDGAGIIIGHGFANSGIVYASGSDNGIGIYVGGGGGFTNSGTVTASGSNSGAGIYVYRGGFTNSGGLTLVSNGGAALYFGNTLTGQTFTAESGSSLIIAGSDPAMVFDTTGTLSISGNAGLSILSANGIINDSQTFVVAENVSSTTDTFDLTNSNSAVFSYGQGWVDSGNGNSGDYTVTVTREGWASEMTGGEGGKFVKNLEDYFLANGSGVSSGSPAWSWLELLNDINSGSTRAEIKRLGQDAARLNTAQATGQSLYLVQDSSRRAANIFIKELNEQMREGTTPAAGGGESSTSVWFSPFYLTAKQDSSDSSISSVDGDWWGFSLGASHSPQDNLNFGLGFHFLKGDLDAGRAYEADSTAWGLDLGFAANLGSGRYRPLLTGAVSHTRHDYDQTRRADGYVYKSSPDIKVTTAAANLSQDFYPVGETVIIRPKIGFDWTRTDMESYKERGNGPRALDVDSEKYDSYRSEVGTALVWKPTAPLELELRAAWLHDFGDRTPILTSVARDVPGLNLHTPRADNKRDSAAVGASASFETGSGFSLGLDYDGQFNSDLDSHQIWASLKYSF